MEKHYVKQCPYCNSTKNHLMFNSEITQMVSQCDDCGYSGTTIFKDIERTLAEANTIKHH